MNDRYKHYFTPKVWSGMLKSYNMIAQEINTGNPDFKKWAAIFIINNITNEYIYNVSTLELKKNKIEFLFIEFELPLKLLSRDDLSFEMAQKTILEKFSNIEELIYYIFFSGINTLDFKPKWDANYPFP